ncbi:hypothetical protein HZS_2123 [Henneguya salminicola]|nr:hypothetical protein HZS_2123 [Henneguya salminicola]
MIRQRINLPLSLPSDAAHLIIPEQYQISYRNENFLLYDGVEKDGERLILFATPPGASTFTLISPSSQFLKFSISCLLFMENTTMY